MQINPGVWSAFVSIVSTNEQKRETYSSKLILEISDQIGDNPQAITEAFMTHVHEWRKSTPLANEPVYLWGMVVKPEAGREAPEPAVSFGFIVTPGIPDLNKILRN